MILNSLLFLTLICNLYLYIYIHIYIHTYIYIHTHIYIYIHSSLCLQNIAFIWLLEPLPQPKSQLLSEYYTGLWTASIRQILLSLLNSSQNSTLNICRIILLFAQNSPKASQFFQSKIHRLCHGLQDTPWFL